MAFITSCSNTQQTNVLGPVDPPTEANKEYPTDSFTVQEERRTANIAISKAMEIPVGKVNFQKLVAFIEKNGFVVPQRGVPCDHRFIFIDSKGNLHALITIKRDTAGYPSLKGTVKQISIWAYEKNIQNQEHFFGYQIREDKVAPFMLQRDGTWKHADYVRIGYEELLAKVSK